MEGKKEIRKEEREEGGKKEKNLTEEIKERRVFK
jgi:hypothetical protein